MDQTLGRYIVSTINVVLNIVLVIAILNVFGVETTTFAALLAAAGVAIGLAWSGLLGNFAAGAFLVVLRPFRVGDFVTVGGVTGTVEEVGLFVTALNTPDNVRTYVGNNKILSDTIQNFSTNAYRRVDLVAQLNHGVDPTAAVRLLKERLARIPNVLTDARPRRRDPPVQPGRAGAGRAAVLRQRALLAGVLRYQPDDPRELRRGRLPGPRTALSLPDGNRRCGTELARIDPRIDRRQDH